MLRIVAGTERGRKIETLEGLSTRPSSERLREAFFGSIQFEIAGAKLLDLFSGSGAIGLEAISRGAAFALLNDANRDAIRVITDNVAALGYQDKVSISQMSWQDCLKKIEMQNLAFDFVYIDPPYGDGLYEQILAQLGKSTALAAGGTIFIEHDETWKATETSNMRLLSDKKYGKSYLARYRQVL